MYCEDSPRTPDGFQSVDLYNRLDLTAHPDIAAALEAACGIPPDAHLVVSLAAECRRIAPDVTEAQIGLLIAHKAKSARRSSVDQPFAYLRRCVLNALPALSIAYSARKECDVSDATHPPLTPDDEAYFIRREELQAAGDFEAVARLDAEHRGRPPSSS
jgi:hypothetical protein